MRTSQSSVRSSTELSLSVRSWPAVVQLTVQRRSIQVVWHVHISSVVANWLANVQNAWMEFSPSVVSSQTHFELTVKRKQPPVSSSKTEQKSNEILKTKQREARIRTKKGRVVFSSN